MKEKTYSNSILLTNKFTDFKPYTLILLIYNYSKPISYL